MIFSYIKQSDGTAEIGNSIEELLASHASTSKFTWIDIENPDDIELETIASHFSLDKDCIDDCIQGNQRSRIDEGDDNAFVLLYGALGPNGDTEFSPRKLSIFVSKLYIITIHPEPLVTISNWRRRIQKKSSVDKSITSEHFLYLVIDSVVDNYLLVSDEYDQCLDVLEERSLLTESDPDLLPDVLQLRRQMLELRRLAASLREALHPIVTGELDFISERISVDFVHVRDHLTLAIESIDNLRELLNGVRDNYHASLALKANSIMQTLTIFASLFLPLSLVAGIYGMNTPLWPNPESPNSFWMIIGLMGVVIITMLFFFKRRKWF